MNTSTAGRIPDAAGSTSHTPAAAPTAAARHRIPLGTWCGMLGLGVTELVVGGALVALILATSAVRPASLSGGNLQNIAIAAIPLVILAIGQLMVIATAGIDLSVGSTFSLVGMVTAAFLSRGQGLVPSVAAGMATGVLIGLFNGFCVAYLRLAPFVVTLVTLSVGASLAFVVTGGNSVPVSNPELANIYYGRILGMPNYYVLPITVVVVAQLVLSFLVFGRWIYAVGSNPRAAELVGIPTRRVLMASYVTSGFCAALASVLMLSYLSNAEVTSGNGLELQAIAAVVIGGASLFGGRGSAVGALLGALIITAIQNTVNLLGINTFWQGTVTGAVILLAVLADRITTALRGIRQRRAAAGPSTTGQTPPDSSTTFPQHA
jgi:ribose transport system permease protein